MHNHLKRLLKSGILGLTLLFSFVAPTFAATNHVAVPTHVHGSFIATDDVTNTEVSPGDDTDYTTDSPSAVTLPLTSWHLGQTFTDVELHYTTTTLGQEVTNLNYDTEGIGTGNLGYVYSSPQPNAIPFYSCGLVAYYRNGNNSYNFPYTSYFLSADYNCEAQFNGLRNVNFRSGPIGYISQVPLPNSLPLYRCIRVAHVDGHDIVDNYYAHDSNCWGRALINGGIFGYTLNAPQ